MKNLLWAAFISFGCLCHAQPSALDLTFNPGTGTIVSTPIPWFQAECASIALAYCREYFRALSKTIKGDAGPLPSYL
jgi:hypothetical protein